MITVIKLGGSLLSAQVLPACLEKIHCYPGQVVIVPGGGVFADQVRAAQKHWGFDDLAAHRMAILSMQQMAILFNSLSPELEVLETVSAMRILTKTAIWSPNLNDLDRTEIAANWDITSDSLAAWLAGQLLADELMLVKACTVAQDASLLTLQQLKVIDAGFLSFTQQASFKITVINQERFLSLA